MQLESRDIHVLGRLRRIQMEIGARGPEIDDLLSVERRDTDRMRNIAAIGVRTFGWRFANRKFEARAPRGR